MARWNRVSCLLILFLISLSTYPALAGSQLAAIRLGRDPEPPACAANPGGIVQIFWTIQHTTTPEYVDYKLQDGTRSITFEHEVYEGETGLAVSRDWTVPSGSPDGKYWARIEYHSVEAGDEANAGVTFYICAESGKIVAHLYQDSDCDGVLDSDDRPLEDGWICIEASGGDRACRLTDGNGAATWNTTPTGLYRIFDLPQSGWVQIGPDSYDVDLAPNGLVSVDFLACRYEECYGSCCTGESGCLQVRWQDCEAQGGTFLGLGTVCDPNPCLQPLTGACCIGDEGDCRILTAEDCAAQAGGFHGLATVCEPTNPCAPTPTKTATWGAIKATYR